jgi:hypothetical protein
MSTTRAHLEARRLSELLSDDELMELHRHVSRLARAAYGRTERYRRNYETGMAIAAPKLETSRQRNRGCGASSDPVPPGYVALNTWDFGTTVRSPTAPRNPSL